LNNDFINGYDLLYALKKAKYCANTKDEKWWPNSGSFEVIIGAILTQNTKWQNVEKALENLRNINALNLEAIVQMDIKLLANTIKPSGFYNTKAKYIKRLSLNIKKDFEDFNNFRQEVTRKWLLSNKGVGFESADSILCYACHRDEMVADAYSYRLLVAFGIELEEYDDIKSFLEQGINENIEKIYQLYGEDISLNTIYARFHGKIVQYCIKNSLKKIVNIDELKNIIYN
jgi:endonuclease-3 related protein